MEQAKSVIYASTRMDVPELAKVRELLVEKFTTSILPDREIGVYPRLVLKLAMSCPERGLCEKYLEAIADSFGIDWAASEEAETEGSVNVNLNEKKAQEDREEALLSLLSSTSSHSLSSSIEPSVCVSKPTPATLTKPPTSVPFTTAAQSAPLPMDYSKQQQQQNKKQPLPDFDEFTRRFEALRKK